MNRENSTKEIAAVKEQVRLAEWREEIEARRTSGLSVRAWCAQQGLSLSAYYHRLRRVREAVCRQIGAEQEATQVPAQPAVVPIRKAEAAPFGVTPVGTVPAIEIEAEGLRVRLSADCPAELVCAMLRELKS